MKKNCTHKESQAMIAASGSTEAFDCKSSVMDSIKCGRIKKRSRLFVVTEYLGTRTTWILLLLSSIGLVNLGLFMISESPEMFFLEFGITSLTVILQTLPYGWFAFIIALLISMVFIARHFYITYRWPYKVFVTVLVLGTFSLGGVAYATGINNTLYEKYVTDPSAEGSFLTKVYCFCTNRNLDSNKALIGEVMHEIDKDEFIVQTPDLQIVRITTGTGTTWLKTNGINRFDVVKVLGKRMGGSFLATHIKVEGRSLGDLVKSDSNCQSYAEWQHKREVKELRRRAADAPYAPSVGRIQLIKSTQ